MIPEVAYYAGRQATPLALIPSEAEEEFDRDPAIVASYFRGRYVPMIDVPIYEDRSIPILVDQTRPASARDAATGWPCFAPRRSDRE